MEKSEDIRRYSADELKGMRSRGEDRTDRARLSAMTEAELEAAIANDPDWKDIPSDWYKDAVPVTVTPKKLISLRIDTDVLDWFKQQGPGYQTKMNAVLRAKAMLADNDPWTFFAGIGDLLVTGPTLTNVNHFRAVLVEQA